MSTANGSVGSGIVGNNGFFGSVNSILGGLQSVASQTAGIYNTVAPIWNPAGTSPSSGINNAPTYQGTESNTGTVVADVKKVDYWPILIGVVALYFLTK